MSDPDRAEDRRSGPRRESDRYSDEMAQHLAALAAIVEATARNVQTLSDEISKLREAVVPRNVLRAEAQEVAYLRRRAVAGTLLFAVALIWTHDEHIERCSPGARAETAVQVLVEADPRDESVRDDIIAAVNGREKSKSCDVTFPLHDHDGNGWPKPYNLIGFGIWGAAAATIMYWVSRARPRPKKESHDGQ